MKHFLFVFIYVNIVRKGSGNMELPFKYIVLCIIRTLKDRNMPLTVNKTTLVNYITVVVGDLLYTINEKKEIGKNFDFQQELDDLLEKYYSYFESNEKEIIFDIDYIDSLDALISDEIDEYDEEVISDFDYAIEGNTKLLDILGVKINKELYDFLLDIEKEIEECYDDLYALHSNVFEISKSKKEICNRLRKLHMKKIVMIVNSKNLLPYIEYYDVMQYSSNIVDRINEEGDIKLLYESDQFNEADIVSDAFLRAIFTNSDSYISTLDETLIVNDSKFDYYDGCSKIKFYITLLGILEREINSSYGLLKSELIKVKYRLMNVLDTVYGTAVFMGNYNNLNDNDKENYNFISDAVYYFINELLMYDDQKYRNKDCNTENIMVYLDNIVKKLLVDTYYKLTNEDMIVEEIKGNELYGINNISSGLLRDIIEKPKTKIKEV